MEIFVITVYNATLHVHLQAESLEEAKADALDRFKDLTVWDHGVDPYEEEEEGSEST